MNPYRATFLWICLLGFGLECRGGSEPWAVTIDSGRKAEILAEVAGQSSSADQLWAYLQHWRDAKGLGRPAWTGSPSSPLPRGAASDYAREERKTAILEACQQFVEKYHDDARVWDARLTSMEEKGFYTAPKQSRALCELIVASPDADPQTRHRARTYLLYLATTEYTDTPEEAEKELVAFEKDYPQDAVGASLVMRRLDYYTENKPDDVVTVLSGLVASPNRATAQTAQRELSLRTKPLDLKFTATDGKTVDLAKLRGKVVLLYFWAANCAPERDLTPKVQALRRKYGAKDFQIIGFSLDEERSSMRRAIKTLHMDWPNINDSKPNKGSATARLFDNAQPHTVWILDRNGLAKRLPHSADLDSEVRMLLVK